MMRFTGPKFVKKANLWCVTVFEFGKQTENWFDTKELAEVYIKELEKK